MAEERKISDHREHLKQLTTRAMAGRPNDIKELVDYLVLSHSSG